MGKNTTLDSGLLCLFFVLCEASIAFFIVWMMMMMMMAPCTSASCTFCRWGREGQACPVE